MGALTKRKAGRHSGTHYDLSTQKAEAEGSCV